MRTRTLSFAPPKASVTAYSSDFGDVALFAVMSALVVVVAMLLLTAINGGGT